MRLVRWVRHRLPYLVLALSIPVIVLVRSNDVNAQARSLRRQAAAQTAALRAETRARDRAQRLAVCRSLNQVRAEDFRKWQFIISSFPLPAPGSDERARTDRFVAFLIQSDAPSKC